MPVKITPKVTLTIADFATVAAMTDKSVYHRFTSECGLSATRIVPPAVKWDRFAVSREKHRVAVSLFKGQKEAFRFSFVPPALGT